jgi:hypothetical protein
VVPTAAPKIPSSNKLTPYIKKINHQVLITNFKRDISISIYLYMREREREREAQLSVT